MMSYNAETYEGIIMNHRNENKKIIKKLGSQRVKIDRFDQIRSDSIKKTEYDSVWDDKNENTYENYVIV